MPTSLPLRWNFSLAVNLLMLTTSVYMMRVFYRVLSSGSRSTLLYLSVIAVGAVLQLALLDIARDRILIRTSVWLERRVAPTTFGRMVDDAVLGASRFVRFSVQIAVLAVGALLVIEQQLRGGAMIAASIIMGRALAPVEQGIGAWKQASQAWEARKRLSDVANSGARQ